MQLFLETSNELGPSVRNYGLGHTMQTQDASNIQFGILLSPVVGVYRNEMSRHSERMSSHFLAGIFRGCSNPAVLI
jgi:hypothetical protein